VTGRTPGGAAPAGGGLARLPRLRHRALYAAFDRFPAPKGAAVHIGRMAETLFEVAGGGLLSVLGDDELPVYQREGNVEIVRYARPEPNYLRRALGFSRELAALLDGQAASLRLGHFRDPWGGVPLLARAGRAYATIYEVNGLPSIELPARYPALAPPTLAKLRAAEAFCWSAADRVIVPAATLRDNLVALGAPAEKIVVIPNGADLPPPVPPPAEAPARYLLYFGALQPWRCWPIWRTWRWCSALPPIHAPPGPTSGWPTSLAAPGGCAGSFASARRSWRPGAPTRCCRSRR
jgi:glycosyltransferase involved in cell wall biosynthesis